MSFSGIFLRHYPTQTPSSPDTGQGSGWTQSPDIIPYGTSPATDSSIFTSAAGYANAFSSTVYLNQMNYVYVRGLNTMTAPTDTRLWFLYVESNVVIWPQNWQQSNIWVNGVAQNYIDLSQVPVNAVAVGMPGFQWKPPSLQSVNDHYCMVAFSEVPPLSSPPQAPLPGSLPTWNDLASYVVSHPNMAWRNTIDVSTNTPTWQQLAPITGAPAGGTAYVGLQATNMPIDGSYSYQVVGQDGQVWINVGKTPITSPNFNFTVPLNWPENYSAVMTLSYWQGGTVPPAGATITPSVMIPTAALAQAMPALSLAARPSAPGTPFRLGQPHRVFAFDSAEMLSGSQMYVHVVGSLPYRFMPPS